MSFRDPGPPDPAAVTGDYVTVLLLQCVRHLGYPTDSNDPADPVYKVVLECVLALLNKRYGNEGIRRLL